MMSAPRRRLHRHGRLLHLHGTKPGPRSSSTCSRTICRRARQFGRGCALLQNVRVRVRELTFERKPAPVKPSKCGFKVHEERRCVVVSLRKKRKEGLAFIATGVGADPVPLELKKFS